MYHKSIAIFLLLLAFATTAATAVYARNPIPDPSKGSYTDTVFWPAVQSQDVNLQSTVYEIFLSLIASMNNSMLCYGKTPEEAQKNCVTIVTQPTSNVNQASPLANYGGFIPNLLLANTSFMQQPVISSTEYVAYLNDKLNIGAQPAYAQGIGYTGLLPTIKIWQAFRNIAYLIATVGFIVLSFMIMFRIRAGQSVINAQAAITKFVFVIIAITFSYAIAGFIVDLIFVFCGLIITLFIGSGILAFGTGPNDPTTLAAVQGRLMSGNVFTLFSQLSGIKGSAGTTIQQLSQDFFAAFNGSLVMNVIGSIFNWAIDDVFKLVVSIAIIYSLFKLLVQLLFAYLQILLLTIMGPLMILLDILPGGNSFIGWMRSLFAHAMIFPATLFVFLVGIVVSGAQGQFGLTSTAGASFDQGLQLPFLTFSAGNLAPLLGLGFILIAPRVNDMVKKAFNVSSFQYSSEIGAAIGVGIAGTRGFAGAVASPITTPAGFAARQIGVGARAAGTEFLGDQLTRRGPNWMRRLGGQLTRDQQFRAAQERADRLERELSQSRNGGSGINLRDNEKLEG